MSGDTQNCLFDKDHCGRNGKNERYSAKRKMTEFYLFLSSRDSVYRKNGFWIEFPKPYLLEGHWTCALTEITLTCDFKPRSQRIYLCSDIVQESYVHSALIELVRNVEIGTRYKKVKSESYTKPIYVPVKVSTLDRIRLEFKDENLQPLELNSNDLHCVLHFKRDGYSRSI